ncbi:hypothetical protein [Hyalangium gracile]|uniref:hypothetical protein n=1 Tax=Hyalangium gracile TaxID=394092 RepID=UPI001CCF0029|nr:hypothetical protein [Hyalangium gracile]
MRLAAVLFTLVASSALAQGTPSAPARPADAKAAPAKPADARPTEAAAPEGKPGATSTVIVRCTDDCTVKLDGKGGVRQATNSWEFKDVAPGQRRVEANGGFLNRPLYSGFADIPGGMKVTAQIDSNKRLTITERVPLGQEPVAKPVSGAPSVLSVRCPKQCSVSIDGLRKGAANSQLVVVRDVPPGDHDVEVKFVLGSKAVRTKLTIPASSEVFATATEGGISITNSKPLAK